MSNIKKEMEGTVLEKFEFPVEKGKIKEFADAICDTNLVYRDSDYARKNGFNDRLMPVTYPISFVFHVSSENLIHDSMAKLGMNVAKSVHGEIEFIYERPVCAGETLNGEIRVGKIYEKEGKRGGKMTLVEIEVDYRDKSDKTAVLIRNTFIEKE